jgi:hypothetical protein
MNSAFSLFNWNGRGLNDRARRIGLRALLDQTACTIACIQETRLQLVPDSMLADIAGPRLDGHAVLPAIGTRGGVLMLWSTDRF